MNRKYKTNSNSALIIILVICAITLFFQCVNVPSGNISTYGEWGNFIGGVFGTFIAGVACYFVFQTYVNQKEELKLARKTAEKQQFETTFFNLIRIHKECVDSLQYSQCFISDPLCDSIENISRQEELLIKLKNGTLTKEELENHFSVMQLRGEKVLYEFFRDDARIDLLTCLTFYYHQWFSDICMIFKYISKCNSLDNKKFYIEYCSAQIKRPEWWLLYCIYLHAEKFSTDKEKDTYSIYEGLIKEMDLFNYGYSYISEKYPIRRDNIYDKSFKHK